MATIYQISSINSTYFGIKLHILLICNNLVKFIDDLHVVKIIQ